MKIELNRNEIGLLIAWSEEATKGKFGFGDDPVGLTWEEDTLLKKLRMVLKEANTDSKKK